MASSSRVRLFPNNEPSFPMVRLRDWAEDVIQAARLSTRLNLSLQTSSARDTHAA